jgi:hypothetical protein
MTRGQRTIIAMTFRTTVGLLGFHRTVYKFTIPRHHLTAQTFETPYRSRAAGWKTGSWRSRTGVQSCTDESPA